MNCKGNLKNRRNTNTTSGKMAQHSNGRRLPEAIKLAIIRYNKSGETHSQIVRRLGESHDFATTNSSVYRFLKRFNETGLLSQKRVGSPKKILPIHREFIDMWMANDNELSSLELQRRLKTELDVDVSITYVRKIRRSLGWTTTRTKYCQLISHKNKIVSLFLS